MRCGILREPVMLNWDGQRFWETHRSHFQP